MFSDNGRTTSVWMSTGTIPRQPALPRDLSVDVCIIGAGIAGLTTAYLLAGEGRSVAVLDDGPTGGGETCRTTAHLVTALDDRFYNLERLHGAEGARLAAQSHAAAIDRIEQLIDDERIDCEFRRLDGYLFVPPGDDAVLLDREFEAARRVGLDVALVDRAPIDSFDTGRALRFGRQGQFDILKYLRGVATAAQARGVQVFNDTHANAVVGGADAHVDTDSGIVQARAIVVATNTPVNDLVAIHTKQAPYRTYVVGGRIRAGSVPSLLLWDTPDPYHYVRLQHGNDTSGTDVLIVGGEDHKTGQADDAEDRFQRLEAWTRERFPQVQAFEFRWSGQVMEPIDSLALIGRNPLDRDNVYIATGDSGNGMTHGTIAGMLLTDLIAGRSNPWADLYDPSRKSLGALKEFARENLNVAAQYADVVTPGEVTDASEIARGEGAIIRRGVKKVAVYRDAEGAIHERSAFCTHLGCVVRWNSLEQTWDCPCHGSRFQTDGHVVNGPANSPLEG